MDVDAIKELGQNSQTSNPMTSHTQDGGGTSEYLNCCSSFGALKAYLNLSQIRPSLGRQKHIFKTGDRKIYRRNIAKKLI